MQRISTPCVSFCWIDPNHGLCEGCGRTGDEVANWCFITEDQRLALMGELKERLGKALAAKAEAASLAQ